MKEREFINPFTDFGFKRIFGQEINPDHQESGNATGTGRRAANCV